MNQLRLQLGEPAFVALVLAAAALAHMLVFRLLAAWTRRSAWGETTVESRRAQLSPLP